MSPHPPADIILPVIERSFDGVPIVVFGDVMLDRHVEGYVGRISPEAPVPVVHVRDQRSTPGGAGNVALNLAGLGCVPRLVGLVGIDQARDELLAACAQAGVDTAGLIADHDRPTITKTRIIGGHQQMLRLDVEQPGQPRTDLVDRLIAAAIAAMDGARAVVISDYAKGVVGDSACQTVIAAARERGLPIFVDPKGREWQKYAGATAISPNRAELAAAINGDLADLSDLAAEQSACRGLIDQLDFEFIALTRSEAGMARVSSQTCLTVPALAREVFDVSGAGDTAIATLAAAMACQVDADDALRLANVAAGVVVAKVGTVAITRDNLLIEVLAETERRGTSKFCTLEQLLERVALWRARGETMVFTNGCFDLLHAGHVSYLEGARACGDRLILGLNSDDSVRRLKGPERPINDQQHRATVLAGLGCIDAVVIFEDDTPIDLITAIQPKVLAKGADYSEDQVVGAAEVKSWGGRVELVDLVPGLSTTRIANKMKGTGDLG